MNMLIKSKEKNGNEPRKFFFFLGSCGHEIKEVVHRTQRPYSNLGREKRLSGVYTLGSDCSTGKKDKRIG